MKILALEVESPGAAAEDFAPHLESEARALWSLQQSGLVREAHFRADQKTAVLVLEAEGIEEARRALAELPLVRAGLIDFELLPLVPYPGYERLFRP